MAVFATDDGNGNVRLYGATAADDGQGNVTLLVTEAEEGEVIAEDEVSLSLVDTSGYASKTELTQTAESITLEASKSIQKAVDDIEVGGRNLVPRSDQFIIYSSASGITGSITEEGYLKAVAASGNENWMSFAIGDKMSNVEDILAEGDEFTISFTMRSADCATPPTIYVKGGMGYYVLEGTLTGNWSTVWYSGVWKDTNAIQPHFGFSNLVGTFEVKNCKIEKGNKPTDWTPAPEDVISDMDAKVGELSDEVKTGLDTLAGDLSSANTKLGEVEEAQKELLTIATWEEYKTQLETTSTAVNTTFTSEITKLRSDLTTEVETRSGLIRMAMEGLRDEDEAGVEIGVSDSELSSVFTNKRLAFMRNGVDIVTVSAEKEELEIKSAEIKEDLVLGGFRWASRTNGNMGLAWIGGEE